MTPLRGRSAIFSGVALTLAICSAACRNPVTPGDEEDEEALSGSCGVERWAVKTGTDTAASQVNMTAQDTTIVNLRSQPVPAGLGQNSGRFTGTAETQLYRLSNVTLTQYKLESDSDYHLVLADSSGTTMIAEIPAPSCVSGGPWASMITAARAAMDAKFNVSTSFQTANVPVTITGVGFFDLLHGQTGVAPNGIELHAILSICFPGSSVSGCAAGTPDFSLGASPASLSTAQASSGTSTISVTGSGGFSGSVALSASGLPAGASSSLSAGSVGSGGTSTLTLNAGTAAAGSYTVTVSGTSGTITHSASIAWTITASGGGGALVNGNFEAGNLSGWTAAGITGVVSTGAHGGTYAAQIGSTTPGGDSSITQQITLPTGSPQLSFWYKNVCADTITYDWTTVTVTNTAGTVLATPLAKTCTNTGAWVQVTASLTAWAGTAVKLVFANHDDNNAGDPTYTLFDDIAVSGGAPAADFTIAASPSAISTAQGASGTSTVSIAGQNGFAGSVALAASGVPSGASAAFSPTSVAAGGSSALTLSAGTAAAGSYTVTVTGTSGALSHAATVAWTITASGGSNAIVNGGFETGTLSGWTLTGPASISGTAHSGSSAAQVGAPTTAGLASIAQTFTVPAGAGPLSFWWRGVCADTISFAWAIATLKDNTANTTATLLPKTCTNTGTWLQVTSGALTAGHSMTLTLSSQGDNFSGVSNVTLYDDVTLSGGAPSPDFSLAAAPASVSTVQGASGTSTVSIAAQNGFTAATALSATGLPTGATASFAPASVSGAGSSTLTLASGTAAAGSYTVTVTGTSGALTHSATIAWTITASGGGGAVVNGTFETGTLSGWTSLGTTAVSATAHAGGFSAMVGSTSPAGDSSISQTVTLPAGTPSLSFWYRVVCADTITYDWASVTVVGSSTITALANTCSNDGTWHQATVSLTALAGQTVTLNFKAHDDNNAGDPTYALYDDVVISGAAPTPDFSLALSTGAVSSSGSAAATATATVAPISGFTSAVSLSASGVPTGASASFSPASVAGGSGSSTLTLTPGTAAAGTYALTISGTGGGQTHTASLSWTLSAGATGLQTAFVIVMENHNWSSIQGSASAPYINNTLLPQASFALNYQNVPGLHPSLPNYLWLEAGTNFGVTADGDVSAFPQSSTQHLVTLLQNAGITWKSYQENITGTTCPLVTSGLYAPKHNPMIYFNDVNNSQNASSANCINHVRPYTELATDLTNNTVPRYNFITPNLCDDMHNTTGCATTNSISNGDTWLKNNIPTIMASAAYRNGGAIFITWDESEGSNVPIGMIVLSPKAKGGGYSNNIAYTHSSTLRTLEEIFGVTPLLGGAATATDLSDLFTSFP